MGLPRVVLEIVVSGFNYFVLMRRVYEPRYGVLKAHQIGMTTRIVSIFPAGLHVESEDRRTEVVDREVKLSDRGIDALDRDVGIDAHKLRGALQEEPDTEDALDNPVVQVACDRFLIVEQGKVLESAMQTGLLDRDACGGRESHDEFFINVGEDFIRAGTVRHGTPPTSAERELPRAFPVPNASDNDPPHARPKSRSARHMRRSTTSGES